jgi:ABC-type microcin C transport system permease subunit YejE
LLLRVDGRWYFPAMVDYTYTDFGGEHAIPVTDYNSVVFENLLEGRTTEIDIDSLYHQAGAQGPAVRSTSQEEMRKVWRLNAPIRYSYKSTNLNSDLERQALVGPFEKDVDGVTFPGGISEGHWLGTDKYGKDVLARLIYGFRFSLVFGFALALSSTVIGCILGALQGYFGGLVDLLGQRITEIWGAIPQLLLLMLLSDFLSRKGDLSDSAHVLLLFGILNLTSWMGMASHMRGMFLRGRNLEFVRAAQALGAGNGRIMFRHILPNSLTPIVTFFPFAVSGGIMALVGLDFLGFGLRYPTPSLGEMLAQGQENIHAWWIIVPTFLTLCVLLILLTFIGEGVRNAFDPRTK